MKIPEDPNVFNQIIIKCFYIKLEGPDLPPRSGPSPYFPWPMENGLTVVFAKGQLCHEYWAGPHSSDRPLPWHFFKNEQSNVFGSWWEKHPLECDFEWTVWDQKEGLPFLRKKPSSPEAGGRSEVGCTQCPLAAAHKTHSWWWNSIQEPSGQEWKQLIAQLATQFYLRWSYK